ncbi:major membrane protein I [Streptomyces jeddahensis]|uniref:Major membrane protein I n=1 Tax=Streptomyces jeddahensis TaxID=1716141 RepID=A0A177HR97_9ACTN|nr:major membrane protein I [Streptomyces jeddahensis]
MPSPDNTDELLSRGRGSKLFLAHPRAIAAFGRECNKRGLVPESIDIGGNRIPTWRGVPIFYLVTAYYSAAVLVPDALGVPENVEIGRWR